jgi:predicted ester cyclase
MRGGRRDATLSRTLFSTIRGEVLMAELLDFVKAGLRRIDAADVDGFVALMAPDCEWVTPDGPLHGRDAIREYVAVFRTAFPDGRHTIDAAIESGDTVAIQGRWAGTHTGPFLSPQGEVPPTGRTVEVPFALFVSGDPAVGQARRVAFYMDHLTIGVQLGLMPEPQATGAAS